MMILNNIKIIFFFFKFDKKNIFFPTQKYLLFTETLSFQLGKILYLVEFQINNEKNIY